MKGSGPAVVIVGGGLVGLSAAYHLRRFEPAARVTVLEREQVGMAASGASAAGVRVMGRDPAERVLALHSLARWPDLDQELAAATGYRRGGGLRVVLAEADLAAAAAAVCSQRADGVPVELIDERQARALVRGGSDTAMSGGARPMDAQTEGPATVRAFAAAAGRLGARIEEGVGASALVVEAGRIAAVERSDGVRQACDVVLLAAGAWSAALLAPLGIAVPLQVRALQMLLTEPGPAALEPVLSAWGEPLSLKQLGDGSYLIGGGWPAEIMDEAGNRWALREESVAGSLALAEMVYPPLDELALVRGWAGIEAFTPDDLPLLGPVPGIGGLLLAAGFSGHGFALAPGVGEILARLALGQPALDHLWVGLQAARLLRPLPAGRLPSAG